jgi:hypothetical protein
MSSKVPTKRGTKTATKKGGWDMAILDTEQEILKAKERLAGLRSALRVFKDCKQRGDPWPGTTSGAEECTYESTSTFRAKPGISALPNKS